MTLKLTTHHCFLCPVCEEYEFVYSGRLLDQETYLPCTVSGICGHCSSAVTYQINKENEPELISTKVSEKGKEHLLVLLRLDTGDIKLEEPVYLVVEHPNSMQLNDLNEVKKDLEFLYNEHMCPEDLLRCVVISGKCQDPHGLFQFEDAIWKPEGFDGTDFVNGGGTYEQLFKRNFV